MKFLFTLGIIYLAYRILFARSFGGNPFEQNDRQGHVRQAPPEPPRRQAPPPATNDGEYIDYEEVD
ncbi:MAG: hypothetical protein H6555_05215 [Lewinellaceae bacterium]|nr:hypothetical protein [Lewinellaceae bacterium]